MFYCKNRYVSKLHKIKFSQNNNNNNTLKIHNYNNRTSIQLCQWKTIVEGFTNKINIILLVFLIVLCTEILREPVAHVQFFFWEAYFLRFFFNS